MIVDRFARAARCRIHARKRATVVALCLLHVVPAFAASSVEHGQVQLRLDAHTASNNDAPNSSVHFNLNYQAEQRTRMRITRVRLWMYGEAPQIVPFTLNHGGEGIGRRGFAAEGSGTVQIFPLAGGVPTAASQIEVVVRFAGERFALRTAVQRDGGPFNADPAVQPPVAAPRVLIRVRALRTGTLPQAEVQRLLARRPIWRACHALLAARPTLRGEIVLRASVLPTGRIREVRTLRAPGGTETLINCIEARLQRLRLPDSDAEEPEPVDLILRFTLRPTVET